MSTIDTQLVQIKALVSRWAPKDTSEYPLVMSYERHQGQLVWWVCLSIRIKGQDDFTIESEDKNLLSALKNIVYNLTRFRKASEEAAEADLGFGIVYPLREANVVNGRNIRTALDPQLIIPSGEP